VFGALTARQGQLRGLVVNSNRVFETTARRNRELAETFQILPTFLDESRKTLVATTQFANNTNPLVTQLRPAAVQLSPTLIELKGLAPDLLALFREIDPLVKVSKTGLPATSEFLNQLRPLLDATDPFLRNLNPMIHWIGLYKHEITSFFSNDVAATGATSLGADQKTQLHYLRTTNPLNPENLAIYPHRISSNRSNPYVQPLGYKTLPIKVFGTYACTTNPIPSLAPDTAAIIGQSFTDLINHFAYAGGDVVSPPCAPQTPLGEQLGQKGVYPHVTEEQP
jgi:ABC-type transporter Mla subunit MlaD